MLVGLPGLFWRGLETDTFPDYYSRFADCSILFGSALGKQVSDDSFGRDDCAGY